LPGVPSTAAAVTATGTILSVAPQVYKDCEVWGGTLRSASGENVTFAAGGVTPLGAQEAATVQTLDDGARQGSSASVTIDYVASRTLCDVPLAHFVTSASERLGGRHADDAVHPARVPAARASTRPTRPRSAGSRRCGTPPRSATWARSTCAECRLRNVVTNARRRFVR
jgi:hypothetical protein